MEIYNGNRPVSCSVSFTVGIDGSNIMKNKSKKRDCGLWHQSE